MKKASNLFLLALLSFSLFGCGSSSGGENVPHNIFIGKNDYCSVSTSVNSALKGEKIEVYVTNIYEDYEFENITVNNVAIEGYTFSMPDQDAFIKVNLKEIVSYSIFVIPSQYALISTNKQKYRENETVEIEYECKGNYVLDSFYVNEEKIDGNSFKMPNHDVNISGTFKYVFDETDWQVTCKAELLAKSFWYVGYGLEGVEIKVKVDDRIVCGFDIAESEIYRDNVDCIITKKIEEENKITNNTFRILVPAIGDANVQRGNNGSWKRVWMPAVSLSYSSTLKYLDNHDGYNGYEINIFISYELLGVSREEALNNISLAIGLRNATHYGNTVLTTYSKNGVNWDDVTTHPIIKEDGSMELR